MPIVTGVRFKSSGRTYFFDPKDFDIKSGDSVIVETARGLEFGDVVTGPRDVPEDQIIAPLKAVVRIATDKDIETLAENKQKQAEAVSLCEKMIEKHDLPMKLIDVEFTFDRKKILFYFTSDNRVDFRELVKDLAGEFKTRIELRQIGVRDEAKLLGGIGSCGRELCCKTFLGDFTPVSIKMAKDQGISLNPSKISGVCGRLMCCLEYEHEFYREARRNLRKPNSPVMTPKGPGFVLDNLMLQEKCKVKVILPGDNFEAVNFKYDEIKEITEEEIEKEIEKVNSMPTNALSFNNPYETWDDGEITGAAKKARNNKNRNNGNRNNNNSTANRSSDNTNNASNNNKRNKKKRYYGKKQGGHNERTPG
ncbi:MAG: stage 0 sporulation family protein [Clostridia bacterium]|nr:stage 0 sporulation family protein [Clostridia bacterium]